MNDHPFGYTNFELRELAGHPHAWEEMDDVLVTEHRLPDFPEWVVTTRFLVTSGSPLLIGVSLEPASLYPWPPKTPLNPNVLRSVKTTDLKRRARAWIRVGPEIGIEAQAAEFRDNRRPGKARREDIFYVQVGVRYLQLLATGSPTKLLASELHVSQSQARDLIHEARRRKLLTKTERGRAGGRLTEKAQRLLLAEEG